jgi:anti-sigma regulatory factor (Ser/Thr protein kinase)
MAMVGDVAAIHMRFDRDPCSASRARRAVRDCLDGETPVETMCNAVLLTSELVTNVVTHTLTAGELVAYYDRLRKRLRIEVRDNSPVLPQLQDGFTAVRVGGFGLRLVDKVAPSWGTTATATGKTVWFELSW